MLCSVAFAQISWVTFMTADQARAVLGPDAAAAIVSEALANRFRSSSRKVTTVVASQIPENWLPAIPDVHFERLTDDAVQAHLRNCEWFFYIDSFRRLDAETAMIAVGERNACFGSGSYLRFRRSGDQWRLETTAVRDDYGIDSSHCLCPK
jgi:hypothetical protein